MGIFDALKNGYDKDDDLKDLEELMYDNESGSKSRRSINDMIKSLELGEKEPHKKKDDGYADIFGNISGKNTEPDGPKGLDEKTRRQQADVQREEEKYDNLLNSMQAQSLIKKVDSVSGVNPSQNRIREQAKKRQAEIADIEKNEKKSDENIDISKDVYSAYSKDISENDDIESVDTEGFTGTEAGGFIKSQCDICGEAARYIENARVEYESVTDYYEDIQRIEGAPDDIKRELIMAADMVDNLSVDRRILKTPDNKLSNRAYRNMEAYEDDFPEAIVKMRKAEDEKNAIARDIRMVKAERSMCRMEAKDLVKKQLRIKKYAQIIFAILICVFVVFMAAMAMSDNMDNVGTFITIAFLAGIMALGLFAYLKTIERKVYVTEIKLNKATTLLNSIKIKYVNAANVLDYQCNKYYIKNAYELEQKYQAYIEMKEEQKKILEVTNNLTNAETDLMNILGRLGVIDTHIWIAQVKAILNPKEMVEVRHNLSIRRQKLRNQIEYNENRIEDAKNNIKNITKKNPEYAKEALQILDMYDKR